MKNLERGEFCLERQDLKFLPERQADSNKGTYGRVLIIAGSERIAGAAYLSAAAAYRMGAGLVRVWTHDRNRLMVNILLPEALVDTYGRPEDEETESERFDACLAWAETVVIGPGIGLDFRALRMLDLVLAQKRVPVVVDADAITLLARNPELLEKLDAQTILTPHLGEMSRLLGGRSIPEIKARLHETAQEWCDRHSGVLVLKDAQTLTAHGRQAYDNELSGDGARDAGQTGTDGFPDWGICRNLAGNNGLSTGGSGDVLTGVIGGLLAAGMKPFPAAAEGVYIHALAGDQAAARLGTRGMLSGDLLTELPLLLAGQP